jgi:CheY-like chemotaxis protein
MIVAVRRLTIAKGRTMSTILVVEDFEDSRFSLCRLLEMSGHEVYEAANGTEAIEIALGRRPDLILMDLSLPDIDGLMAAQRIRLGEVGERQTPIIILSAHDTANFTTRAFEVGCNDYLTKPVDYEELEKLIDRYL